MGEAPDSELAPVVEDLVLHALDELPAASVMVFDSAMRFVLVRGGAIQQAGPNATDFEGRLVAEALPEAQWAFYRPLYEAALGGERSERRVASPDGQHQYLLRVSPVWDASRRIIGGVAIASDITREAAEEAALAASEHRYRMLVDNAAEAIFQQVDGELVWISPAVQNLLGWTAEELVGHATVNLWHPDDRQRAIAVCDAAYSGIPGSEVMRIRHKDGHYIHAEFSLRPAPEQGPGGMVGTVRDVSARVEAECALWEAEEKYRLVAENASDVVLLVSDDDRFTWVSPSSQAMLGWTPESAVGRRGIEYVHPDDLRRMQEVLPSVRAGEPRTEEYRVRRGDGTYVWVSVRSTPLFASDGTPAGRVAALRDVDESVRARAARAEAEERYRMLAENTMDLVIALDNDRRITWVSSSVTDRLGYLPDELVGTAVAQRLIHTDDCSALDDVSRQARLGVASLCRVRLRDKRASEHWVEVALRALRNDAGAIVGEVLGIRDIHEVVLAERALAHEVDFDALTGLAKRSLAIRWIEEVLQTRRSPGWALLCVGVDGMTAINQGYTYAAGDRVLRTVAERLVAAAGARDRVARVAGDEFVVLLREIESASDAANAAKRLATAVRGPISIGGTRIQVSACVGIAQAGLSAAEELLRDASMAMRQAAAKGYDRWEFLDESTGKKTRQELSMQLALHEAMEAGRIQPWLMPIAEIHHGTIVGYEALVRWVQANGDVVMPDKFLDLAERTGQIRAIDRAMLTGVISAMRRTPAHLHIAVNVSAATLATGGLDEWVRAELLRTGVEPARLHLEVTETALLKVSAGITGTMRALADMGVSWWVDDFGTGFSSISHIRDLPVSGLKLDQSFTMDVLLPDSRAAKLSRGLAGLAAGLGLRTVAEGIESSEQAGVLAAHGWRWGQGWLFGKAAPIPEEWTDRGRMSR